MLDVEASELDPTASMSSMPWRRSVARQVSLEVDPAKEKEQQIRAVLGGLELAQASIFDAIRMIQEEWPEPAMISSEQPEEPSMFGSEQREAGIETERTFRTSIRRSQGPLSTIRLSRSQGSGPLLDKNASRSSNEIWRSRSTLKFRDSDAKEAIPPVNANMSGDTAPRLPVNWPSSLGIRNIAPGPDEVSRGYVSRASLGSGPLMSQDGSAEMMPEFEAKMFDCKLCIREPDSVSALVSNICGCIMLLYDLVAMPVVLAWDVPFEGAFVVLAWSSLAFWLIELILSFFTGFFEEGVLNMNTRAAAMHYLRTWFSVDVLVVTADLFSLLMLTWTDSASSSGMGLRVARFAKLGRLVRITGLLRVVRAVRALEVMVKRNLSDMQRTGIRVMVMAVLWLWMNHILACVWYAIGRYAPTDTGARWLDQAFLAEEDSQYATEGSVFQYATALHWAIAQSTLGAMEVASVNTAERIFNVVCLFVGLFFGSMLISLLSAGMVEFRMSMRLKSHTMSTLRRYLLENNVSKKTALLVQRQVAARLRDTAMLTAEDVPGLATLATGLRQELHCEICKPHLRNHQLFQLWHHMDRQWFQQFCFHAVDSKFLRPEDDLFLPGSESTAAYFIISGGMEYTQVPECSPVTQMTQCAVEHGVWLCPSTLWVHWIHVGKMVANARCQVLAIKVEGTIEAMREHAMIGSMATSYGRIFAERVVSARPPQLTWPNDLNVPFTGFGDVVVGLSAEMHVIIGSIALDHCRQKFLGVWKGSQAQHDLRLEVESGRSIVILSLAGEIERVVSLAAIRLVRDDFRILVQLAKWDTFQAQPKICLPAVKCLRDEAAEDAIYRYLATELAPVSEYVEVLNSETETSEQQSARFGVRTQYVRKLFSARLTGKCMDEEGMHVTLSKSTETFRGAQLGVQSCSFVTDIFENVHVYFVPKEWGGTFCAWLCESDLLHLEALQKNPQLRRWLSNFTPDDFSVLSVFPVQTESW